MSRVQNLTLSDVIVPPFPSVSREVGLILAGNVLTILSAQIAIPLPFTPVPITGLTFGVLLCGALLGWRRAMIAQLMYLSEGACGLPVFAHFAAGAAILAGPTGGYLIACPFAAALTGLLAERKWDRNFFTMFAAMLIGSIIIFAGGLIGLSRFVPATKLLQHGLLPFIPGDLIKAALAAAALPTAWKMMKK